MRRPTVLTGLDVLCRQDFADLAGLRIGLLTHPAAVNAELRHVRDLLSDAPNVKLAAVFGPEHGLHGEAQDLEGVATCKDGTGVRTYSLYGDNVESLKPTPEQLQGLDVLVIDLQDIGSRYYTFQATMLYCMHVASQCGVRVIVLDRPNPIGGDIVEGPALKSGFQSFVGCHPIATRHGMTMGELALLYAKELNLLSTPKVIHCKGWKRSMDFDATGLPWVLPSPNMPTVDTAFVYPGQCLLEGTNLSEGRGTTRPFELCGAPWIEPNKLASRLAEVKLPGVVFRPTYFKPTFQKFAGQTCGGVQMHLTERQVFQPVRAGLAVLMAMRQLSGPQFRWRTEPYEFVADRPAIDLLFGSDRERLALEKGRGVDDIVKAWGNEEEEFRKRRESFLLYL